MQTISYWKILTRKKILPSDDIQQSKLGRVLGTMDLAALGIGATLGVGVYVLAGHVSRDQSGPSVILSFLIAAMASFLAGLCYSEFGARVPKSGSAYIYSYVTIGEFVAFIIGWNLLLEYIIGSASVSKGLSLYLDTLINDTFKNTFIDIAPMSWDFLAPYFDFFAFGVPLLLGIALAFGLKKSAIINNMFTLVNIGIVLFVIIAGSFKADIENWRINPNDPEIPPEANVGNGGFFPFGFSGTLRGAATCFFGYVGFDCIATTGEEVKNPRKAIPMAILISLFVIFMAYFGVSTVLTLMYPYYLQDVNAPLPHVFSVIGWPAAKWLVAIGGIFGLIASLFGAMFPLPRIIYAIAQDGLIFRTLGTVHEKWKTPVTGTLCAAFLTGSFAALFDLKALINMLSIGTLLAYTVVAISILILRFSNHLDDSEQPPSYSDLNRNLTESSALTKSTERLSAATFFEQFFNIRRVRRPTSISMATAGILVVLYCIACLALALTIFYSAEDIINLEPYAVTLTSLFVFLVVILLVALAVQPREQTTDAFCVPLVPLLPGCSIFVNIFLMLMLDYYTWIRFGVWMLIGVPMYMICVCTGRQEEEIIEEVKKINKIGYEIHLNGTINQSYKRDTEPNLENETITARTQIQDQIDEILDEALEIVSQRQNENDSLPSTTPQNCDEIVPESELQLREKRTGNGSSYFTEETISDSDESKDCDQAIAMLDNILNDEEEHTRKYSDASLQSPPVREAIATAIVHHENDIDDRSRDLEKPVFSLINDNEQKLFLSKLNTLMQQKSAPSRKMHVEFENEVVVVKIETPRRSKLSLSKSVASDLSKLKDAIQMDENNIPIPPVFDPEAFSQTNKRKSSEAGNVSNTIIKHIKDEQPIKNASVAQSDEEPELQVDIRQKLEQILQQKYVSGLHPTETDNITKETPKVRETITTETEEIEPDAVEIRPNNFKDRSKKFDTVEKQKLLFANVLAEFNPSSSSTNLKRTSSRSSMNEVFRSPNEPIITNIKNHEAIDADLV